MPANAGEAAGASSPARAFPPAMDLIEEECGLSCRGDHVVDRRRLGGRRAPFTALGLEGGVEQSVHGGTILPGQVLDETRVGLPQHGLARMSQRRRYPGGRL